MEILKYFFCLCLIIPAIQANPARTPSIEVSAEQLTIAAGASDSVTCTPGGNPLPSVEWRKVEGEFGAGTKISGNTLLIGDAQDSDRGYYVCVGVLGGTDVAQKYVYVDIENVDPSTQGNPKVTVSQRTISVPRGGRGKVDCTPEGNPLPRVQWIKSNGELPSEITINGNTLIISDAREEDRGDYVCQGIVDGTVIWTDFLQIDIENVDPSTQGNPKVTVSQRTISVPRGGRGKVDCTPEGNPLPRVQWIKSNGELPSEITINGNTLIISDAREEDRGDYVCQGIVDGTVIWTDFLQINIENVDPSTQGNPKVTVSQRTISVPRGGRGKVDCTPEGNPLPRVQWIKSNGELPNEITINGNTLIISDAREEDRGDYVCQGIVDGTVIWTDFLQIDIENVDPSTQGNPQVTVSQRTISVPRGGRGKVDCTPEGNPLPRVQWIKSNGELPSEITINGNTLIISDAREEDRGDYVCQGIVDGTVIWTDFLQIDIENVDPSTQGNPKVTVSQRTISVPRGGRGKVDCTPEGNPLPRVQWIKSNGELPSEITINGNTLIISDAREEDRGDYVCQGIVDGTVIWTDFLQIDIENVDPSTQGNPKVTVSQRTISVPRGGRGKVDCTPEGNPLPRVQWIKSNGELPNEITINGNTLIISDAREEDRGDYVCQGIVDGTVIWTDFLQIDIENVDPSTQGNPQVTVSQRTISVPRGGRGKVDCTPEGNPLPRVQWIKSNGELPSEITINGNTLIISDAREEDRGDYVCQGIVHGTVIWTDFLQIDIENVDPSTQGNPKVTVSQRTISVPRGGRGEVDCTPEGNPLPRVQWIKSNGELPSEITINGNTLIISDAREEDRGDYVCQGIVDGTVIWTNFLQIDIENVDPTTQGNPKVTVSQRTISVPRGGRGKVDCTPEGNPLPRVQWIKSNGELPSEITINGNTLIISDAREEDRGDYVCQGIVDGTVIWTDFLQIDTENVDPSTQGNPKVTVSQRTISVPRGGRGKVDCTPEGNPLPRVQWIKSNGELPSEITINGNTLIISDAREEDRGDYVCQGIVDGTVIWTDFLQINIENVDPSTQGNPKVTVSQRTISVPRGGRGKVDCTPEGNPLPRVQWIKSNGELPNEITINGNTLIISDAREEDRGDYVCQGIVDGTVIWTDFLQIDIENVDPSTQGNPQVTVSQRTISVPRGGRGKVDCTPEGNPLPRVQWIKSNGELPSEITINGNTLIISDAREEDRGDYVCQGIVDGTVIWTDFLQIDIENVDPSTQGNPKVTVSQRTISVPRGGRGKVDCTPEGNPLPRVQWIKSNGELPSEITINGNTLIISDAREEDRGDYVCQGIVDGTVIWTDFLQIDIENVDPSTQGNPKVTVSQRTISVPRGGRGKVDCTPEGNPLPRVQWIKSNGELPNEITINGNTLIISDAREEDRGDYVCQGIVDGTVIWTDFLQIDIENVDPSTQGNPQVTVSQRTISVPRGGRGKVDCTPEGNPLPRVQWIKSNGELPSEITINGNTLIISDAREEDRGDYVCQGIVHGTVIWTDFLQIDIENVDPSTQGNPKVTVSQRTISVPRGGRGEVDCTPEGNPLPRVQWIKSNGELPSEITINGNTLIISDAREEDRGDYVCQGIVDGTVIWTNFLQIDIENVDPTTQGNPKVTVSQRTISVPRGGRGKVDCTPEGNPLPRVQWIKSNGELPSEITINGNTLIISDAREEDRGDYVCQGIVDGTVIWTDFLQIDTENVDPSTQGNPKVTVSQRTISVPRGGRGKVDCTPEGNPLPRVQWIKSNGELPSEITINGNTLIISDAREEDRGDYVCQGIVDGTVIWTDFLQIDIESTPDQFPKPLDVVIPEGSNSTISCDFATGDREQKVTWTRRDQRPLAQNAQVLGKELLIKSATKEDSGEYLCKVTASRGGFLLRVAYVRLEVAALPLVSMRPPVQTVTRGEAVTVECVVDGDAQVTWQRVDGSLSSRVENQGSKLYFNAIEVEDAGYYRCQAENRAGISSGLSQVIVNDVKPPAQLQRYLKLIVSQRQLIIPKGGDGSIECTPEGNPLPRVQWIKSNGDFRDGIRQRGNTLIITDAREEDRGHYACQGIVDGTVMLTNYSAVDVKDVDFDQSTQGNPKVTVSQRTISVPRGGRGNVECTPEGYPLPRVQWIKSNGELPSGITISGNKLIISDAREEDQGDYVCQGIVDGTVIWTDYLQVHIERDERPRVAAGNPRVQVNVRQLKIPKGGNGTVECIPEGNPLPTTQWSKHEGAFGAGTIQSGNSLIISDAQEQDGGYYVCDGMVDGTAAWTDYLAVEIESNEPISQSLSYPRVTVSLRQLKIPRGGSKAIQCTPEGSPLPTVQWSKDGGQFSVGTRQSGNSLLISDAQEEDRGNYVCSAIVDGNPVFSDYLTVEIQYICELPQETGSCRSALNRWYYDTTQQRCQKFIWGGCGGNKNNFETEEQCSLECESIRSNAA